MRRLALWLALAGLLAGVSALWLSSRMRPPPAPPPPAPPPEIPGRIDARLLLREGIGEFVFVAAGTTDLPPRTVLRVRVFAVDRTDDPHRGIREDEEPLVWEDDERQPKDRAFRAGAGTFEIEVCRFPRRPYSIVYRVRVTMRPEDQDPDVRRMIGEDEISVAADLPPADASAYAAELRIRHAEAQAELDDLEEIFRNLRRTLDESRDPERWGALSWAWDIRLEVLEARNRGRFDLWTVYPERQARMRLGGIAEQLRRSIGDATALSSADPGSRERLRERLAALAEYLDETREWGCYEIRLDPEIFRASLVRYERAIARLPAARRDAIEALLACAPPLRRRGRAYAELNEVGRRLALLLEKPGPETRSAHDRSLAAFKKLAGLP